MPREEETAKLSGDERVARLLELLVRLQVHSAKGERNKTEMVLLLKELGFTTIEIVSFLGVPRATAAPIISRAKAKGGSGRKTKNRGPARR